MVTLDEVFVYLVGSTHIGNVDYLFLTRKPKHVLHAIFVIAIFSCVYLPELQHMHQHGYVHHVDTTTDVYIPQHY